MPPLQSLIDQYYIGKEKEELLAILDEFGFTKPIQYIISQKDILQNKEAIHQTAAEILVAINQQMVRYKDEPEKKLKVERILGAFAMNVFREVLKKVPNPLQYVKSVKDILKSTCEKWGWNYNGLNERFNIEILEVGMSINMVQDTDLQEVKKLPQQARLVWHHEAGNLDKLCILLFEAKLLKSKRNFYNFFEKPSEDLRVKWDSMRKPYLAYLLYRLKEEKIITSKGTKSSFAYAEKYFTDEEGVFFAKNYLKELSSKINQDKDNNKLIINKIEQIIAIIKTTNKPLLDND
ncbi:MAG: hypothetical protein K1X92_14430 [Bacteroidia bacterium]|nr:hypothetical protein [Bacteroidia bacterium]